MKSEVIYIYTKKGLQLQALFYFKYQLSSISYQILKVVTVIFDKLIRDPAAGIFNVNGFYPGK